MMPDSLQAGDEVAPGTQLIEVRVSDLTQLFNSMDPSPFHEKDLDDDAENFIESWAKDLPPDKPLALLVHLDKPAVTPDMANTLREAVHGFFNRQAQNADRRLRDLFRVGRKSLAIGLTFLAACLLASDWIGRLLPESRLAEIAREGLLIGGWVAMWRPLEIFLYAWWPIRAECRLFERLGHMPVRIVCPGARAVSEPRPA